MGGYLLFGQHQGIIQRMWRDVFEACMTTNSCLAQLWTENVEETKVNVFVTRHRQIEMALQYFHQKCQPLRQLIENVTFLGGCNGADEGSVSKKNKLQKWDGRFSSEDESRKQSSDSLHLDYIHLDLSSTCINGNNHLKIDCSDEKMSPKTTFSVTAEPNPTTMIMTDPQEEKSISNTTSSVTNSSPLTENEIYDRKTDRCLLLQTQNNDNVTNHNLLQTDNEQDLKSSSSIIAFGDNYQVLQKDNVQSSAKYQRSTLCLNNTANKSRNEDSPNRVRKDLPEQEDTLLKISLENLRIYLCEKPSSSFDVIYSCSNNFEKLKYLRTKEKESPSVRISCAFQQGYYLETLFPGRRIRNQSGNKNYAEHLQELNMSHSYSRQLRQFYKSFRYYRRFLHLYVPLRTILRNITRIRDKIDLSEDEQLFWSLMPINGLRIFYECYSYWFGLDLCDVYTIFDVIDNYPGGTVDQFLQSKCVQLFQCEGFLKALNWLQNIADRNKYLLVYKTLKRAHCVVVEKDEAGWSYEKSFDLDKDNIIFVGFYIFIKHH